MKKELLTYLKPKSPISEIFRTLRTNIQFMNVGEELKTILVTSTMPKEGKSWVSANLAVAFAQTGKKVVIVDADMRMGRQYSLFGVSPKPGLSNYLSGVNDNGRHKSSNDLLQYFRSTYVENLYVIPAGEVPPNPSELLVTTKMTYLLNNLKTMADIIIFDGTPSQLVTDALILTRLVDTTIIVIYSKKTKKEALGKLINDINHVGGNIAGVVLNQVAVSVKQYEQSYYYGSTTMSVKKKNSKTKKIKNISKREKPKK